MQFFFFSFSLSKYTCLCAGWPVSAIILPSHIYQTPHHTILHSITHPPFKIKALVCAEWIPLFPIMQTQSTKYIYVYTETEPQCIQGLGEGGGAQNGGLNCNLSGWKSNRVRVYIWPSWVWQLIIYANIFTKWFYWINYAIRKCRGLNVKIIIVKLCVCAKCRLLFANMVQIFFIVELIFYDENKETTTFRLQHISMFKN